MAVNTKLVKSRISSVKNTKKITKAMEMISAVKMRKAVQSALNTREYAVLANNLLENLDGKNINHKLAKSRTEKVPLLILITSNRGLCGSYNSKVLKKANEIIEQYRSNGIEEIEVIALGNKAAQFAKAKKTNLVGIYDKLNEQPILEDTISLARNLEEKFLGKEIDSVTVVYTNYISGLVQEVDSKKILPVSKTSIEDFIEVAGGTNDKKVENEGSNTSVVEYEFEPEKKELLNYLLPALIEIQLFQALLESAASEHSSRMLAMKNASEAAGEMIDNLTLEFNKGRQAAITQEISEIVAGASAI